MSGTAQKTQNDIQSEISSLHSSQSLSLHDPSAAVIGELHL